MRILFAITVGIVFLYSAVYVGLRQAGAINVNYCQGFVLMTNRGVGNIPKILGEVFSPAIRIEGIYHDGSSWNNLQIINMNSIGTTFKPANSKTLINHGITQQVDSAEASTIAVPPSEPSGSPR